MQHINMGIYFIPAAHGEASVWWIKFTSLGEHQGSIYKIVNILCKLDILPIKRPVV